MSLDTITNDLRKAILQDLIKNPKLFRGGKDDVQKWIEDIDHLMEVAHVPDTNRLDLILYSLRGDALQWYKSYKSTFTSWDIFVQEIKKAFTSSFREELVFKTLESYVQAENQSVRNFYHAVLKLCKEADANMSDSTKLKNLLNKLKPSIQFEVRKKRSTTIAHLSDYAKEVEELLQLSGTNVSTSSVSVSKSIEVSSLNTPSANISSGYSRVFRPNQFRGYPRNQQYPFSSTQFTPSNTYNSYRRYANPTFPSNQRFQPNRFQPSSIPMNTSHNIPSHAPTRQNVNSRHTNSNFRPRTANAIQPLLASADIAQSDDMSSSTINTGATTTFINSNILHHLTHPEHFHRQPYSFVLADGVAPFSVLGSVNVTVLFSHLVTTIQAHVAPSLCTDMILGMDYINKYNLHVDIQQQLVSIEHKNTIAILPFDKHRNHIKIPVTTTKTVYITPNSSQVRVVSIPISSIRSIFILHPFFRNQQALAIDTTKLEFKNYSSTVMLLNISPFSQTLRKGTCLGYLLSSFLPIRSQVSVFLPHGSIGAASCSGVSPTHDPMVATAVTEHASSSSCDDAFLHTSCPRNASSISDCSSTPDVNSTVLELINSLLNHTKDSHQKHALYSSLVPFHKVFDTTKHNIARTPISHLINTVPHYPFACRPYPQANKEETMYTLIQEFLHAGLISESNSPYAAPALMVKKKDGSLRFVVDYKRLNAVTIKDSSPLPNMEDTLQKLGRGYSYFSKLDLKSGFYQIPITDQDKKKTAFITPFGLYQFNVLPMGLRNSPPTFQRVMTHTLKSCRTFSLVYIDDIIVYSKSFSDHLNHVKSVLSALQASNLILNPPKCALAVQEIDYLGHTINISGIKPTQDKIAAILQIPEPRTLSQANSFIGALGWYRKFLPDFARVAAPIHSVTNLTRNHRYKFKWLQEQSDAFKQLKHMLNTAPLFLHYPIDGLPLVLTTDASNIAIGGVLQQEVEGTLRNLYYHSQIITPAERKY
ncbi:unnamed protein product, partial [Rotaria magnacalcarata]